MAKWLVIIFFAVCVATTVAAGWRSQSRYMRFAALILAFEWIGSVALWIMEVKGVGWRYVVVDFVACAYFAKRWMEANAQHRIFHFVLMSFEMTNIILSLSSVAFSNAISNDIFNFTKWYQLSINILYTAELTFVIFYSLLRRRAKNDPDKWRSDTDDWLDRFRND